MDYLAKSNVDPVYLPILGPLLVPSPRQPRLSLKSMIKLGRENVFQICVGNTFLHRYNREVRQTRRIPCKKLHVTYPFVRAKRNSTSGICFEEWKYPQLNHSLSLYVDSTKHFLINRFSVEGSCFLFIFDSFSINICLKISYYLMLSLVRSVLMSTAVNLDYNLVFNYSFSFSYLGFAYKPLKRIFYIEIRSIK